MILREDHGIKSADLCAYWRLNPCGFDRGCPQQQIMGSGRGVEGEGWWTWKAWMLFSTKSWLDVWHDARLLFYTCSTKAGLRCLPACRPEALINMAVERVGVFETQSFHPAFRSLSNNSEQWGHSSAALTIATTGTKQHSPTAALCSI